MILNVAPPLLAFQAISTGRLFMGDRLEQVRFETATIQTYIDTRPLREFLAKKFKERVRRGIPKEPGATGQW